MANIGSHEAWVGKRCFNAKIQNQSEKDLKNNSYCNEAYVNLLGVLAWRTVRQSMLKCTQEYTEACASTRHASSKPLKVIAQCELH